MSRVHCAVFHKKVLYLQKSNAKRETATAQPNQLFKNHTRMPFNKFKPRGHIDGQAGRQAKPGQARQGKARHGKARQGKERQGKARQGSEAG